MISFMLGMFPPGSGPSHSLPYSIQPVPIHTGFFLISYFLIN